MLVMERVGAGHELHLLPIIPGRVSAEQQDCGASRVEGVQHAIGPPSRGRVR